MNPFEYPFDAEFLLSKKKRLRRELLAASDRFTEIRLAILGGSTTSDIKLLLELFLLRHGIKPTFFESEYNRFYEDAVFGNPELDAFHPDLVFIHTTYRNILRFPAPTDTPEEIQSALQAEYCRFAAVWASLEQKYRCARTQRTRTAE